MAVDGALTDKEGGGNLTVCEAICDKSQHLQRTRTETAVIDNFRTGSDRDGHRLGIGFRVGELLAGFELS